MTRHRLLPLRLFVLAVLCACGAVPRSALAREVNNRDWNFLLDVSDGWNDETAKAAWEKDGIRWSAVRRLDKLENGKVAQGEGGRAAMSVVDAPKGKTLAELAADPAQRAFLMNHFGKESTWPAVETEEKTVNVTEGGETSVPAVLLKTKGLALNLAEVDATMCYGNLMMALAGGKLFRLKLLAWPTDGDPEMVRMEVDVVEMSFQLVHLKKEKAKEDPGGRPNPGGNGGGPGGPGEPVEKVTGDSDKDFPIGDYFVVEGWKAKKPKKLATVAIDKAKDTHLRVQLSNTDTMGACTLQFLVYANDGMNNLGVPEPAPDLRKWYTTSWWTSILATYALGPLSTYPWPKKKGDFLVLPLMTKEEERVIAAEPKDRAKADIDIDAVLRMKKEPFVEEVAKAAFGKVKCQYAIRGVIRGNAKTIGPMIQLRYGWKTEKFSYLLYIQFQRDGLKRYETTVREFLESLEITK
jgi:hypothetical protein